MLVLTFFVGNCFFPLSFFLISAFEGGRRVSCDLQTKTNVLVTAEHDCFLTYKKGVLSQITNVFPFCSVDFETYVVASNCWIQHQKVVLLWFTVGQLRQFGYVAKSHLTHTLKKPMMFAFSSQHCYCLFWKLPFKRFQCLRDSIKTPLIMPLILTPMYSIYDLIIHFKYLCQNNTNKN